MKCHVHVTVHIVQTFIGWTAQYQRQCHWFYDTRTLVLGSVGRRTAMQSLLKCLVIHREATAIRSLHCPEKVETRIAFFFRNSLGKSINNQLS